MSKIIYLITKRGTYGEITAGMYMLTRMCVGGSYAWKERYGLLHVDYISIQNFDCKGIEREICACGAFNRVTFYRQRMGNHTT